MDTTVRRKVIDIPENTFKYLSMKAAEQGTNLKKYIEELLNKQADEIIDSEIYAHLERTRPEGKVMLNEQEQDDFETWLMRIKRS